VFLQSNAALLNLSLNLSSPTSRSFNRFKLQVHNQSLVHNFLCPIETSLKLREVGEDCIGTGDQEC